MTHVFISYAHKNADFTHDIAHKLAKMGIETWIDRNRLVAGDNWRTEIDQAITNSFAVIVVMSQDAFESKYVTYEWAFALGQGKRVIPILIEDTSFHPVLEAIQYIDFSNDDQNWTNLLTTLETLKKQVRPEIRAAASLLSSPKKADWLEGIESLYELRDSPQAVTELSKGLFHQSRMIRVKAGEKLKLINTPQAIEMLKSDKAVDSLSGALFDNEESIRRYAIELLLFARNKACVNPLCEVVSNRDETIAIRTLAAKGLGTIGDSRAIPSLIDILLNPEAVESRKKDPFDDIFKNLLSRNFRGDVDQFYEAVAVALVKMGDEGIAFVHQAIGSTNSSIVKAVVASLSICTDSKSIPFLLDFISGGDEELIAFAVVGLVHRGVDANSQLVLKLQALDWKLRKRILASLRWQVKGQDSYLTLLSALINDKYAGVREVSAEILSSFTDNRAINLLEVALRDEKASVKDAALKSLKNIDNPVAREVLHQAGYDS